MAQRTIVFDDLDNETPDATTVPFGFEGMAYEIDLAEDNRKRLKDLLDEFINAARKVGRYSINGGGTKPSRLPRPVAAPAKPNDGTDNDAIRAWAKSKGIKVKDRGRIPGSVVEQYKADSRGESPPEAEAPKKAARSDSAPRGRKSQAPSDDELLAALNQAGGNVSTAAEHFANELGVSVSTARGWITKAKNAGNPAA